MDDQNREDRDRDRRARGRKRGGGGGGGGNGGGGGYGRPRYGPTPEQRERMARYPPDSILDDEQLADHDNFVVPSSNEQGQTVRLSFSVPPGLARQMEIFCEGGRFPYETGADLLRHALARHLEFLVRCEPSYPRHFIAGLRAMQKAMNDDDFRQKLEETFTRLKGKITEHLDAGRGGEAVKLAAEMRRLMNRVEQTHWRDEWQKRFQEEFGYLLGG